MIRQDLMIVDYSDLILPAKPETTEERAEKEKQVREVFEEFQKMATDLDIVFDIVFDIELRTWGST